MNEVKLKFKKNMGKLDEREEEISSEKREN